MRHGRTVILLVDDAQFADEATRGLFAALAPRLAGRGGALVLACRAGTVDEYLRALDAEFCRTFTLRRLDPPDTTRFIGRLVHARPDCELVAAITSATRGNPAAIERLVTTLRNNRRIVVVDDQAHLVGTVEEVPGPAGDVVDAIRTLGEQAWSTAKALAVLGPFNHYVAELLADASDVPRQRVLTSLAVLAEASVINCEQGSDRWQVAVPAFAAAIRAGIGPYERSALAEFALRMMSAGLLGPDCRWIARGRLAGRCRPRQDDVGAAGGAGILLRAARGTDAAREQVVRWHELGLALLAEQDDRVAAEIDFTLRSAQLGRWADAAEVSGRLLASSSAAVPMSRLPEVLVISVEAAAPWQMPN